MNKRRLLLILHGFWAIPLVILMRLLTPFLTIRAGQVFSARIGHFVTDSFEHVVRRKLLPVNAFDFLSFGEVSNVQWAEMIKREIRIFGSWTKFVGEWNRIIPGGKLNALPSSFTDSRDLEGLFVRNSMKLPFTDSESIVAEEYLLKKGWQPGEPYICLLVRDDSYIKSFQKKPKDANERYSRDSDVKTYIPAILWLIEQGVWVLRMGKVMAHPVGLSSKYFIDYAFDPERSDLLDVWLFANCNATISTGTGPDVISLVYQRPILFLNVAYLTDFWSYAYCTWVPKWLYWKNDGNLLSITEQIEAGGYTDSQFDSAGIRLVDLDESEILCEVKLFWDRINGTYVDTDGERILQDRFWQIAIGVPKFRQYNSWRHPHSKMGKRWLSRVKLE
jgi:putative glycosyltransferase (TIGR04372 family)